jgi:hypothetical protein
LFSVAQDEETVAPPPAVLKASEKLEFALTPEAPQGGFTFAHNATRLFALRLSTADAETDVTLTPTRRPTFGDTR